MTEIYSLRRDMIIAVWAERKGIALKQTAFNGKAVRVQPANQDYVTRKLKPEQLELQWVVVIVHRIGKRHCE